ncbi:uncharacterized protein LOC135488839 [Lineus longissimus]|uniref:uncharacterized protein LOC135488839 n=1 Tax=Lineus longissimus TaxID=88925 RepID=UPI002B4CA7AF
MDVSKFMNIPLPPIPGEPQPPSKEAPTSKKKVKPVDEYDDSLSEGEIRDSDDDENIEDDGIWLSALVDTNTVDANTTAVDMDMALSDVDSSGEVSDNDEKNQNTGADDKKDELENADYQQWNASEYPDYDTSSADWYPDQDSATPSVIQKQTNSAFENQYDPDGPPIDYYIPWIMRQTKYDSQPYYRPIPILDDAYYMYDWDFGEPFKEDAATEPFTLSNTGNTFSVRSRSQSQKKGAGRKKPNDSSDSDDEKPTSLIRRMKPELTPAQPITTLSNKGTVLGWLQCMFCGRMFVESMAFDNHVKYVHGKESKSHNKQVWQPRAFKLGHSWKCELCHTHDGNASSFLGHLRTLHHLSNLVLWGDWEKTGYTDGQLQSPTPISSKGVIAFERISDNDHSRWYMLCMLCRRCLDAKDYSGKLVRSGTSVEFTKWEEFLKHLISYHSDENVTSEMIKLVLYLVQLGHPDLLPLLKGAAGVEEEAVPEYLFHWQPRCLCYTCGYRGHTSTNCPSTFPAKSLNQKNQQNSNLQVITAQSMSGGANMTQTGGQGQYAGWNNATCNAPVLATATTSAYEGKFAQTGSGAPYPKNLNDAQSAEYGQPQQGDRGNHEMSREDSETPPRGKRRRRHSESSEDGYDSDEARLGSRIHHAARRRSSRDQHREGSLDKSKTSSSYSVDPGWGSNPYQDHPSSGTSSYHQALSQYRSITDERRKVSSSHEEKRLRRERRERSYACDPSPEAYIDPSGKQVIDYHNKAYSQPVEDIPVKQESDDQGITESPPAPKMPDFMDLANILQTANKQSARKQQLRAQGMTELLKTLYSSKGASQSTSRASTCSSAGQTSLSVFDTMQKTIHKILREEKKIDQPEPTKGGSTRLAVMKITEKLYKEEFAEGTELGNLLVERVIKDFVAVKSAGSISESGPAGPVILDPRIRAAEEEKAQLTVLIRRHAEELRLIQEAKKLAQTVDMSSSEEEVDEEAKEETFDPSAAQKKLLLIAYGVILDALAPGAIQTEEDSQIAADIILQLTHHMFNLLNQKGKQTSNTIGLQEKYMIVGQLKSRYQSDHALINALECAICISLDVIHELCKLDIDSLNKLPTILGEQPGLAYRAFQDVNLLQEITGAHFAIG